MGRKKKNNSEKLAALAREFYETEGCGNPAKLKCSNFARYAKAHGCDAQAYDFRRDEAVRAFMDEILKRNGEAEEAPLQTAYRTLDIDALLLSSSSMEDFKRNLREMDSYWHSVYDAAVKAEKNKSPAGNPEGGQLLERLNTRINFLEGELSESERRAGRLEEECRRYRCSSSRLFVFAAGQLQHFAKTRSRTECDLKGLGKPPNKPPEHLWMFWHCLPGLSLS